MGENCLQIDELRYFSILCVFAFDKHLVDDSKHGE